MAERESGVVTWAVLALSVAVCAAGAVLLWLVMTNREPTGTSAPEPVEQRLEAQSFDEYSWEELAEVAGLISSAPTDEEGRSVAEKYGVAVGDEWLPSEAVVESFVDTADDFQSGNHTVGFRRHFGNGIGVFRNDGIGGNVARGDVFLYG